MNCYLDGAGVDRGMLSSGEHRSQSMWAQGKNEQGEYWRRNSFGGHHLESV